MLAVDDNVKLWVMIKMIIIAVGMSIVLDLVPLAYSTTRFVPRRDTHQAEYRTGLIAKRWGGSATACQSAQCW